MYAILTRNDVSLDKNSEETIANAHVSHVESAFTGRHVDLLTLLKQAEGTFEAKLIKEREERIKVAGMVAKVLTAMNETRVGLNDLRADVLNLCEAAKIGERLDNLDTELVALKTRDPQVAVCVAPLMGHLLPPKLDSALYLGCRIQSRQYQCSCCSWWNLSSWLWKRSLQWQSTGQKTCGR
jgi:hypothetical protein